MQHASFVSITIKLASFRALEIASPQLLEFEVLSNFSHQDKTTLHVEHAHQAPFVVLIKRTCIISKY